MNKKLSRAFYSLSLIPLLLTANAQPVSATGQSGQSSVSYQHVAYDSLTDAQKAQLKTGRPTELATYANESYILVYRLDTKASVTGTVTSASSSSVAAARTSSQALPRTGSQEVIVYVIPGVGLLALAVYFHKKHKKTASSLLILVVAVGLLNGTSQVSSQSLALLRASVTEAYDKGEVMAHTPETVADYTYIGYLYTTDQEALASSSSSAAALPSSSSSTSSSSAATPSSSTAVSAPVTVNYLDENGQVLTSSTVLEGGQELGTSYVVSAPSRIEKDGLVYELVAQTDDSAPASGKASEAAQTVSYSYKPLAGKAVTLSYLDAEGKKLQADTVVKADGTQVGTAFERDKPAEIVVDGLTYGLTDKDKTVSGKVEEAAQNLTAVYEPKAGKAVTVSYLDSFGNSLQADTVVKADGTQIGTAFEFTKPSQIIKDGLTFVLTANQAKEPVFSGKVTAETQTAELVYVAKPGGSVVVNYLDGLGNPLLQALEVKPAGTQVGTPFQIAKLQELTKGGLSYIFDDRQTTAPSSGTVTESNQTFDLYYLPNPGGAVTLTYVDESGSSLQDATVIKTAGSQIGTAFQATRPLEMTKDGLVYVLKNGEPLITGQVTKDAQTFTATYEAKRGGAVRVNYVDESGNALQASTEVKAKDTQVGTSFRLDVPATLTKDGLVYVAKNADPISGKVTEAAQDLNVSYVPQAGGAVTVKTVDTSGTSLQADTVLTAAGTQVGTAYSTTASNRMVVNGDTYELVSSDTGAALSGTVTTADQTVVLTYRKLAVGTVTVEYWGEGYDANGNLISKQLDTVVLTDETTKYGDVLTVSAPATWAISGFYERNYFTWPYTYNPMTSLPRYYTTKDTVTVTETDQVVRVYYGVSFLDQVTE